MKELAVYFLMVVSPTYGDETIGPMTYKACMNAMHEKGAELDSYARIRESQIPPDLNDREFQIRLGEVWNFKARCTTKRS